jgi:tape measure domain-containing protein
MAVNPTVLEIKAKISGLKGLNQLKSSLRKLGTESVNAENTLKGYTAEIAKFAQKTGNSINSLEAQKKAFEALRRSVDVTGDEFKQAGIELEKLDKKLAKAEGRKKGGGRLRGAAQIAGTVAGAGVFGGAEGAIGSLAGAAFGGPAGAIVGGAIGAQVGGIRKALGATAEYAANLKKLRIALLGVTTSNEEYARSLQAIEQGTEDYAIPQEILTRQFTKLQASVQGAGGNLDDTKLAFNGIVAAVRATGGSLQDVDSALTATAQVFSKGKVSAEELRQQIGERLPGAFSIFAESIGKTPQELDKALEGGKVSLQDFQTFSAALLERYGENAKIIASGPESAGDRLQVSLSKLSESVGALLAPIGSAFQETFITISDVITKATNALNKFFGVTDDAKINKNTVLIQAANKSLVRLRAQRADMQKEIEEGGDPLGVRSARLRDINLDIKSITDRRQSLRDEINSLTSGSVDIARPDEGTGLPGITETTKTPLGGGKTKGPGRADFSMLEGAFARDAALRVAGETAALRIKMSKAEAEGNRAQIFALKQEQERLKVNQIIVSLKELTRQRAMQIANAQAKGMDVTRAQSKQLDDLNNLQLAMLEKNTLLKEQELGRLIFNREITAELEKQRKSFEDQFLDRQKELGLISSSDYNKVLLGREKERLADPKLGLSPEQQARGLDQYRQTIDPTLIEGLSQNIRSLKKDLEDLINPINQITGAANAIGSAFSQSFTNAITGATSAKQALSDFFKSVGSYFLDMAGQIIAKMVTMAILNAVVGLLPGSSGGGGFNPNAPSITGNSLGDFGGGTPFAGAFRANGGPVTANTPYIVGERGRELFIPRQSGVVTNNEQFEAARKAMGGAKNSSNNAFAENAEAIGTSTSYTKEKVMERERIASINSNPIDVRTETTVINNVEYVTVEQFSQGMKSTARDAQAKVLSDLRNRPATRAQVGIR